MNRLIALAATVFVVGCHPKTPAGGDAVAIARLEASRGPGIPKLVALARGGNELAIRALGRVGGKTARDALIALLPDPRAATALGIACALDEPSPVLAAELAAKIPKTALETLGRCGDASSLPAIVAAMPSADAALALGRFGRRKLAITSGARTALAAATASPDRDTRYAAAYALAREFQPPKPDADRPTIEALQRVLGDKDPEVVAIAVSALGRRKSLADPSDAAGVATLIHADDWRVVVEVVRALVDPEHEPITNGIVNRDAPHAILELVAATMKLAAPPELRAIDFNGVTDPLAKGWIACRIAALHAHAGHTLDAFAAEPCAGLPAVYRDNILGELAGEDGIDSVEKRGEAIDRLLAKPDRRAQLAALGAIATFPDHARYGTQIAALVASPDPVIASAAIDAAAAHTTQPELVAALVARAATETAPDLLAQIYAAIETNKLDTAPCQRGLTQQPIAAAAAAKCLHVDPPAEPPALAAPPFDPATVIGKHLRWHVTTTRGEIVIALHPEIAPWTVATIVGLTTKHFYDNLDFHRVVPDFVVQGGDPTMTGGGGPGFSIPAEPGGAFATGGVGIADSGRDTGGSQWFVMHSRAPHLDGRYTWFGVVESGQKSADALQIGDKVLHATIEEVR